MIEMHKECPMPIITKITTPNSPIFSALRKALPKALAVGLLVAFSGTANAQDALGQGNALDANPGQAGRINPTRPSFARELSFRNAIATGNAPGGLSFRGDLGYRAAGEFSGDLGSDSLFAFRRDSLYSGLAGMGIRGTDALQYQFALTTGSVPTRNLMGNLSISRSNYSNYANPYDTASKQPNTSSMTSPIGIDTQADALDRRGKSFSAPDPLFQNQDNTMLGTLRSSSTYTTTSTLQPALLSVYTEGIDRKPVGLVASPLLGITSIPLIDANEEAKKQAEKQANTLVARPQGTGLGANANPDESKAAGMAPGAARLNTSYDATVEQMRQRVEDLRARSQADADTQSSIKPDETNDAWLLRQMQELREQIYGQQPADQSQQDTTNPANPANPADPTHPTDPTNQSDSADQSAQPSTPTNPLDSITDPESPLSKELEKRATGIKPGANPVELYDPTKISVDPETLEVLRGNAANTVDRLFDPNANQRDVYAEHMSAGQQLIADERYFDAEERFTHALASRPRDVSAQLGRLHAQIGAGMVLSASVNLQSLLSQRPELIASKYAGNLLPSKPRIESLIDRLKERTGITTPKYSKRRMESDRIRVSSAMVLAYLAYQIDDTESIAQALAVIDERGSDADKRFASLLEQIWNTPPTDESGKPNGQD